ncbi:hypothetical protein [Clostridium sp. 1001271B_151109_B4]|uniref:hypothetical protein n=1 Tax=Clostridium sp. 1001271B_151109_B4 TaxID=2787148 RepID=UPI0018A997D9|nr:hypothetical protein [Clostridium sp. 1001271B_151109_B4]
MYDILEWLSKSKAFVVISGIASIVSLIGAVFCTSNQLLWCILTLIIIVLILIIGLFSYNKKLLGKLDNVNLHIIGENIELESDFEENIYINKEGAIVIISANLSLDRVNEQHSVTLELRLPPYLEISIDYINGVKSLGGSSDFHKISVPLTKEINYVKIKSFSVASDNYDAFLKTGKKIDVKIESKLIKEDKNDYISFI